MRTLDVRRHARRDPLEDTLSLEGRLQAEMLGATLPAYDIVFTSPKKRAAETLALFLQGSGRSLPPHAVVDGLVGPSPEMAGVLAALFEHVPEDGRGLAVSHTPVIEEATETLTGVRVAPLRECAGVRIERDEDGRYTVEELEAT